jgi:hypothetical protein
MYAEEYKSWILRENAVPQIVKTINSFKQYLADAIALANQTAAQALQHGYRMTAMDDDMLVASYGDSLANCGATFAATQETMKSQANSLVAMQNQLANIQLCMNVGQQPPSWLHPCSATMHVLQPQQAQCWRSGQWPWFLATANHELWRYGWWSTAEHSSSQSLQTLGELELLSLPGW